MFKYNSIVQIKETLHDTNKWSKFIRNISSDFSNKRITRIEGDVEIDSEHFNKRLINRNPLNLEQLSHEKKPSGFWLDKASPSNYNRIVFERNGRHLDAALEHWSGRKIIHVSTREKKLSKYYKNPNTVQAASIIAQVLAMRCLRSGFISAGVMGIDKGSLGIKTKSFFDVVKASGLELVEMPEISPRTTSDL